MTSTHLADVPDPACQIFYFTSRCSDAAGQFADSVNRAQHLLPAKLRGQVRRPCGIGRGTCVAGQGSAPLTLR
ncbi:hypothetical protein [Pseudomonas sp. RT6P73]